MLNTVRTREQVTHDAGPVGSASWEGTGHDGTVMGREPENMPKCAKCSTELGEENFPLRLTFSGGYSGFIDTLEDEPHVELCGTCAIGFVDESPWAAPLLQYLNINIGHECLDGTVHWVPMAECVIDPDRHGWATVYTVSPRHGAESPARNSQGRSVRFGLHRVEREAIAQAAQLQARGLDVVIRAVLLGNETNYGVEVDPDTWTTARATR